MLRNLKTLKPDVSKLTSNLISMGDPKIALGAEVYFAAIRIRVGNICWYNFTKSLSAHIFLQSAWNRVPLDIYDCVIAVGTIQCSQHLGLGSRREVHRALHVRVFHLASQCDFRELRCLLWYNKEQDSWDTSLPRLSGSTCGHFGCYISGAIARFPDFCSPKCARLLVKSNQSLTRSRNNNDHMRLLSTTSKDLWLLTNCWCFECWKEKHFFLSNDQFKSWGTPFALRSPASWTNILQWDQSLWTAKIV